jgi:selenocysteine-specific elongation factor
MIIGTAGHIDHGKTALVKALTGIDTDRLKEEKRRGITLELGFAHLELDDGSVAGVVDVPGHERFVKAMVAGAGGVDLAILVIAADEGVMPQTREHLDICRLLGVRAGVIAVTKSDLLGDLGEEWLSLLRADIELLTKGTFLEDAKLIACSSKTGEGLKELKSALSSLAKDLPARSSEGPLFLPVDRAFTMKGFGTIVTGTLLAGQLKLEESVSLLPGLSGPFRVRGLQVHGAPVDKVAAGQRVAVNVSGVETEQISRGMVLSRYQELPPTRMLDVELTLLSAVETPLPKRKKLLLHLGTAQVEATVALLDSDELRPGETGFAQLRLGAEVLALPGQRFILRGFRVLPNRGATLAGGQVLTLTPPKRRKGASEILRALRDGDAEARLVLLLNQAGYRGLSVRELFARSALPQKILQRSLDLLGSRGGAMLVDKERRHYLSAEVFASMVARSLALIQDFHQREPMKEGLSKEELRQRLFPELEARIFGRVVAALLEGGEVESSGEVLRLKGKGRTLTAGEETLRVQLLGKISAAGLGPPRLEELASHLSLPPARVQELMKVAVADRLVVRVSDDLYFDRKAVEHLQERLIAYLQQHKEISTQTFKDLVGQSRKYVIPLSEFFDREKVTLRVGEKRVLRRS